VSKAVRQRCVALALHLGHSSSSTQAIGVKRPSNKVLNILQACACWNGPESACTAAPIDLQARSSFGFHTVTFTAFMFCVLQMSVMLTGNVGDC